ncbi:MAG: ACP synthase [Archangium sp.]|nr:ACP synthase [Archangium sp.]
MSHPGSLVLRRLHAGESVSDEVKAHVAECDACRAQLAAFAAEQQAFEASVPFERFATRVERGERRTPVTSRSWRVAVSVAVAAMLAITAGVINRPEHTSRIKGGTGLDVRIADNSGAQRQATKDPEPLAPGERLRVEVTPGDRKYALVVSLDDQGVITPLYLENGRSFAVHGATWLPDSIEFTGTGLERLIVVLSSAPLTLDTVSAAVEKAYTATRGDLTQLTAIDLHDVDQIHHTFRKP